MSAIPKLKEISGGSSATRSPAQPGSGAPAGTPATSAEQAKQLMALARLAQLELEIRTAPSAAAIAYIAANDTFRVVGYDHAAVWLAANGRIAAVAGALEVDPTAPAIRWLRTVARRLAKRQPGDLVDPVTPADLGGRLAGEADHLLPRSSLWVPFAGPTGVILGGMIVGRDAPFLDGERRLLARLGSAYGGALAAHQAPRLGRRAGGLVARLLWVCAAAGAAAALALPIRATALSEARVTPIEPHVVAAPLEGIVKEMIVRPNQDVRAGEVLLVYEASELRAQEDVLAKRVTVLRAETLRAEAQSFTDTKAKGDVGVLRARLAEGEAELAHAREKLKRVELTAERSGVALFDDPTSLDGRPVRIGERLLLVADPDRARLEIQIAVEDALVAEIGSPVEFFLAVAPDEPIRARITRISYEARPQANQSLAFVAEAELEPGERRPRLGLTGTAKVYGRTVSLGYALARKPLAVLRRSIGL